MGACSTVACDEVNWLSASGGLLSSGTCGYAVMTKSGSSSSRTCGYGSSGTRGYVPAPFDRLGASTPIRDDDGGDVCAGRVADGGENGCARVAELKVNTSPETWVKGG
eukprot:6209134-Pleurochrysis_carterae.AAC.3